MYRCLTCKKNDVGDGKYHFKVALIYDFSILVNE